MIINFRPIWFELLVFTVFITNPHPGFLKCENKKVLILYYQLTKRKEEKKGDFNINKNKKENKKSTFSSQRTIGIRKISSNNFKRKVFYYDEIRYMQSKLKEI